MGVNAWLDTLPRTRFGGAAREVPAFRACGVVGFHMAVGVAMGAGLLSGASLLVVAVVAVVCAASFFVYVYARKWITGHETLELLDQVWFAELCTAAALLALGLPLLPYLDVLAVALCPFLAAGRVGCTLVGCCHGRPSSIGIVYGEEHVRDGLPAHLEGVRLFPVPAIEATGLIAIGATGVLALPFAAPGHVFAWFLIGYAVLRFGLEWMRGDPRPHWAGLSKPQWMALAELAIGVWVVERASQVEGTPAMLLAGVLLAALGVGLALRRGLDPRARLLSEPHLGDLREAAAAALAAAGSTRGQVTVRTTPLGVSVAASTLGVSGDSKLHLSIALPTEHRDTSLLCGVAALSLPHHLLRPVDLSRSGVLHLISDGRVEADPVDRWNDLYGSVVRRLQRTDDPAPAGASLPVARGDYFGMPRAVAGYMSEEPMVRSMNRST